MHSEMISEQVFKTDASCYFLLLFPEQRGSPDLNLTHVDAFLLSYCARKKRYTGTKSCQI